jgi:SAM-dependent methyltransferase
VGDVPEPNRDQAQLPEHVVRHRGRRVQSMAMVFKRRVTMTVICQFHQPQGVRGHVAGWVMAHRPSNRQRNHWVVSLLDLQSTDRVLEIGFGPGLAIAEMSRRAINGKVYGVDHSHVMLRQAAKRNAEAIREGRVVLIQGSSEQLPTFEESMDLVVTVNSLGFWPEPEQRLLELRSRLRPGGRIAVATQPRCPGATKETSLRAAAEIEKLLRKAGFCGTRVETLLLEPPVICVLADNR